MGHELSHVLDFKSKNRLKSMGNLKGHFSARFIDKMEYNTDLICIKHGLGEQLEAYSKHLRISMNVQNWRGVDYVLNNDGEHERYMNPSTIKSFTKKYTFNQRGSTFLKVKYLKLKLLL